LYQGLFPSRGALKKIFGLAGGAGQSLQALPSAGMRRFQLACC
jgi:hypothetical protein